MEKHKKSLHLPKDSVFTSLNHSHWRNYAQMNIQLKDPSALHYSAVQSFAIRDFSKFKAIFLQAIDESRALAKTSPGEEVFVATCDVFRL